VGGSDYKSIKLRNMNHPINKDLSKRFQNTETGSKYPLSFSLEKLTDNIGLPGIHSFACAVYDEFWLFIGGETVGFHGTSSSPAPFLSTSANNKIWLCDTKNKQSYSIPIPEEYLLSLAVTNAQFYQVEDMLYMCGGYAVTDVSQENFNTTSNSFFKIHIPTLIQYVINQDSTTDLDQIFLIVIQDDFVRVTGGALMIINDLYYLVGGQDYEGVYSPGSTGNYTNAIRSFSVSHQSGVYAITSKETLTDADNLHRRDFNLLPYLNMSGEKECILSGGVFTSKGLSYNNPVYIKGLSFGQPAISIGTMEQKCNQYTCANIPFLIYPGAGMMYCLIGGISYMRYDSDNDDLEIGDHGVPMPFSNLIDVLFSNTEDSYEFVQIPPGPLLPGYIGSNACFIPEPAFLADGHSDILDINKVLTNYSGKKLIGYMYGGILSEGPTSGTTPQGYVNTYANDAIYAVYIEVNT
jgi:hypothetical protein